MHELGIMTDVLDTAVKVAKKHDGNKVTKITLKIGLMSGVVPYFAKSLFETLAKDTICEGCELVILEEPAVFQCSKCGEKTSYRDLSPEYVCDACGSESLRLLSGYDFKIYNIGII